jgi:hypothetical protein
LDVEIPNSKELRRASRSKYDEDSSSSKLSIRSKSSSLTHAGIEGVGLRVSPFRKILPIASSSPKGSLNLQKRCKSDGYDESTMLATPDTPEPEKKEGNTFARTSKWLRKTIAKDPSSLELLPVELQQSILWEGKELVGATLEQLLALLSYDSELRNIEKYQKQFICVYRSYLSNEELLKYLIERFQSPLSSNLRKQRYVYF